ncbi:spermatogenesis-associated protein 22-like [Vanessa cardui]|uniref:spermatogenesis-associated protein 22-like n=1 Tax=Vanessa cardui TaxID=171605 RepID=UPI001F12EA1A|nr:spermatogenesis-associated protein 22-like [Vanessa cardui]
MSGIDPRYLAAFADNAGYIATDTSKKQTEIDLLKNEVQYQVKTRGEKLKGLNKSGTRVYSGTVENILKWHKSLQDIGIMVLYEIVGKCVSVRAGESCAKNLVVRDDNGPAIQVVYYEIDFLLTELKIPCMIRVIGRIMPGTSRLQAFNVRPATGDDVASLPRRAAVASHHITKLCKEYFN